MIIRTHAGGLRQPRGRDARARARPQRDPTARTRAARAPGAPSSARCSTASTRASGKRPAFCRTSSATPPWSGRPMSGTMDIEYGGREITPHAHDAGAPRRPCGSSRPCTRARPSPCRGSPAPTAGEALTGAGREVFRRSAFIGQGEAAVTGSAELERRIAAVVSTGEEGTSCSEALARLKAWQNRRRSPRPHGRAWPELESELAAQERRLEQGLRCLGPARGACVRSSTDSRVPMVSKASDRVRRRQGQSLGPAAAATRGRWTARDEVRRSEAAARRRRSEEREARRPPPIPGLLRAWTPMRPGRGRVQSAMPRREKLGSRPPDARPRRPPDTYCSCWARCLHGPELLCAWYALHRRRGVRRRWRLWQHGLEIQARRREGKACGRAAAQPALGATAAANESELRDGRARNTRERCAARATRPQAAEEQRRSRSWTRRGRRRTKAEDSRLRDEPEACHGRELDAASAAL